MMMSMSLSTETKETIALQLNRESKQLLERAAAKHCMTLNEYLLKLILDAVGEEQNQLAVSVPTETIPTETIPTETISTTRRKSEKLQLNLRPSRPSDRNSSRNSRAIVTPRPEKEENWLL
ncbi:MAG: hypothetical protein AB4290_09725 [Spirulina sp.]